MTTREELKKLTGRAKQLAMVQSDDLWPAWPALPMIKVDRAPGNMDLDNCGLLLAGRGPVVYPGNMLTGPIKGEPKRYQDWDSLLDDWRVD